MNPSKFIVAAAMVCLVVASLAAANPEGQTSAEPAEPAEPKQVEAKQAEPAESVAGPAAAPDAAGSKPQSLTSKIKSRFIRPKAAGESKKSGGLLSKLIPRREKRAAGVELDRATQKKVAEASKRAYNDAEKLIIEKLKVRNPNEATKILVHETFEQEKAKDHLAESIDQNVVEFVSKMQQSGLASMIPSHVKEHVRNELDVPIRNTIYDLNNSPSFHARVRGEVSR